MSADRKLRRPTLEATSGQASTRPSYGDIDLYLTQCTKCKRDAPSSTRTTVWNSNKLMYFKLAGNVWAVNADGVPGQCQALPKYKQIGGQQRVSGGKLMTRKFARQQNCSAASSSECEQLICQGRGYEADTSTAEIGQRRDDSQRSHAAATRSSSTKIPSVPAESIIERISVARTAACSNSRSLSQLSQSISIQRLQLRPSRAWQSNTKSPEGTVINSSFDQAEAYRAADCECSVGDLPSSTSASSSCYKNRTRSTLTSDGVEGSASDLPSDTVLLQLIARQTQTQTSSEKLPTTSVNSTSVVDRRSATVSTKTTRHDGKTVTENSRPAAIYHKLRQMRSSSTQDYRHISAAITSSTTTKRPMPSPVNFDIAVTTELGSDDVTCRRSSMTSRSRLPANELHTQNSASVSQVKCRISKPDVIADMGVTREQFTWLREVGRCLNPHRRQRWSD